MTSTLASSSASGSGRASRSSASNGSALNVADFEIPDNRRTMWRLTSRSSTTAPPRKLATRAGAGDGGRAPGRRDPGAHLEHGRDIFVQRLPLQLSVGGRGRRPSGSPAASSMFPICRARWRSSCGESRMREFWSSTSAPTSRQWIWRPASARWRSRSQPQYETVA